MKDDQLKLWNTVKPLPDWETYRKKLVELADRQAALILKNAFTTSYTDEILTKPE